jgi:hypothetical protein
MHHSMTRPFLFSYPSSFSRLNFLNHLPSINSGPEQVEGNALNLFYGCQPPPRAR